MKADEIEILKQALKLPPQSRAALAGSLLDSLDEEIDENAEAEWAIEIQRRLHEIDSGDVKLVSWAEARRKIFGH